MRFFCYNLNFIKKRKVCCNLLKDNKKNFKSKLIALICVIIILPLVWILVIKYEGENPSITLGLSSPYIGKTQEIPVSVIDVKSGIKKIWIGLVKEGKEIVVYEKEFPGVGLIRRGKKGQITIPVKIEPETMGITDGRAILRMVARDFSWRKWWNGNIAYIEKEVTIDTNPPAMNVLSRIHNVSQGGAGLVIYKLSEPCQKSGVYVEDHFFPGHSGYFKNADILMAFFAIGHNQGPGSKIFLESTDFSGNVARSGFSHYLKKRNFRKDTVRISDSFLKRKMVEFDDRFSTHSEPSLIDKFLQINRELRQTNHVQINELVQQTDADLYWDGAFLRLPNSARKAGFADYRQYTYNGRVIDHQVHQGVDLASVAHSPIPAANSGKVVFAGNLGIYGKTVMIDHGFGLFSMYSHMSSLTVAYGQMVSKGGIIGRTGSTGLAGGDHLHFGMLVHNTFVNPIEWWDGAWIKNNILGKIDEVKSFNQVSHP